MTLLSYTYSLADGQLEDITQVMANFNSIKTLLNGQLDDSNIVAAAGIQAAKLGSGYLPSKLAAEGATSGQVMTFNGSIWAPAGATSGGSLVDKFGGTTAFNNSAAENTLYSKSISAGLLGTDKCLYLVLYGNYYNASGSSQTFTLRVKYGATTLFADASPSIPSNAQRRSFELLVYLSNKNSTGSQNLTALFNLGAPSAAGIGVGDIATNDTIRSVLGGSSAEDSTLAKTLAVTWQHGAANANLEISNQYASLMLIG